MLTFTVSRDESHGDLLRSIDPPTLFLWSIFFFSDVVLLQKKEAHARLSTLENYE